MWSTVVLLDERTNYRLNQTTIVACYYYYYYYFKETNVMNRTKELVLPTRLDLTGYVQ